MLFRVFVPWKFINTFRPSLLSLLQSTATQVSISINIFICFKHYTVWNQFFLLKYAIKIRVKVLHIQICFKCETFILFFLIKTTVYKKKLYRKKNLRRLCEDYWITCCTRMTLYAIWVDELTGGIMINTKKINKN